MFRFRVYLGLFPIFLIAALIFHGCAGQKHIANKVKKQIKDSKIIDQYQVGFALHDLDKKQDIYMKDGHKYYTPASNTKLYTFYAALKMLPATLTALRYVVKGDSLIFWGTGDPSFLQTKLKGKHAYDFLKASNKQLFYAPGRYTGDFYGGGWQWDDYNDYYQAEINELPLSDNLVEVRGSATGFTVSPRIFLADFQIDSTATRDFRIIRDFNNNVFRYPQKRPTANFKQQIPVKVSVNNTLRLLSDTLKKTVMSVNMAFPAAATFQVKGMHRDSVLKEMMLPSDNFIAEQLLLLCADQLGSELNTRKVIAHIQKNYLQALPDKPVWADGSGLSRYNLFTPADMIVLLDLIYKEFDDPKKLFALLPAGGKSGTLRTAYPATENPFVYGKTGTLSNTHNQSGYILTKKGRTFSYAFLNNNYVLPTAEIRKEMARIVTYIHNKF